MKYDKIFILIVIICILVVGSYAYSVLKQEIKINEPKSQQNTDIIIIKNQTNSTESVALNIQINNKNGVNISSS